MLFTDSSGQGVNQDVLTIEGLVTGFCSRYPDSNAQLNTASVTGLMHGMRQDFPYADGLQGASPFKKAANFICYWVAERPLTLDPPPTDNINAHFALMVAIRSLHGASLGDGESKRVLENPIELSKHSFVDIADALSNATPQNSFKLVSVLLEQMTYKTNPDCQYPNVLV